MYSMSITSFGVLIEILLCIRGCKPEPIVSCPSANVNVGSTVVLTCTINPAEAMTWKRDTDALANCDTFNCAVISSPGRYTFATDSGGQTVKITIAPVEPDDDNKEFTCVTSTSSDSCKFSVSSTTMASTIVHTDNIGLIAVSVPGGMMVVSMIVVSCYMIRKGEKQRRLDQWRREFKLIHEHNQLIYLKKIWKKPANNKKASFDCVFEVYPERNEIPSVVETRTLARQLVTLLGNHLNEAVSAREIISDTHGYKTQLESCSLFALLKVVDVLRDNSWNKILREKNQYLRTQVDETSFRDCITHFKDQWRRQFTFVRELKVLKYLNMRIGKNANDGKASFDCVIEVYSTETRNEIPIGVETRTLAGQLVTKLDTLLGNHLYKAVSASGIICVTHGYETQLQCRSLSALLKVVRVLRGNKWNKILREMEQENQFLRTQVDETSFRGCVNYFERASSLNSVRCSVDSQSEDTDSNSDLETY